MPNYDYKCLECGDVFEVFQMISEEPLKKCPACGGRVKRMIGPGAGLIFKGSGFFATDYKRKLSSKKKEEAKPTCSGCNNSDCSLKESKNQDKK
ncbi:MAG: zinc ribbon domain-containing protein [Candidatus Omnitrophica bacterium]|nr:zinc ribbon domain-containing protein [Candidatus Omnitrophota bacterium]MBD3269639.1 zinc ribbon domain-containing protein [Candidatus Omnitrophota bacterium]